jgi:hypothetical protein
MMTGIAFAAFYTFLGHSDRSNSQIDSKTNRVGLISGSLIIWSAMTGIVRRWRRISCRLLLARIGVGVGEAGLYTRSALVDCRSRTA